MSEDLRDRVIVMTADDLDAILKAIELAVDSWSSWHSARKAESIVEQLRGRHDLPERG